MRVQSSANNTKSKIRGAANNESSHVLCITIVLRPPMKISEVYSSIALLLSPTYGTYCKDHKNVLDNVVNEESRSEHFIAYIN